MVNVMVNALAYGWRVLATGFCFAVFGIGGLLLRVLVFPLLALLVREPQRRIDRARSVIRFTFRLFIEMMQTVGVLRYRITGSERLARQGLLILANHPTLIDTVFLMALVKHADCIVKSGLWNNPFTRGPVRAANYINNDQGVDLVLDCIASLNSGNNLIIFPEGTRTGTDGAINLKRGAANIAVRGARNVTPVIIRCDPKTLSKGDKWWHIPPRQAHFLIDVQDDIAIAPFLADNSNEAIAARRLTDFLQVYFTEENQRHA